MAAEAALILATPASAVAPEVSVVEWPSSGFISCTTSSGTVYDHDYVYASHGWRETTTNYYDETGALSRTRVERATEGGYYNLQTEKSLEDTGTWIEITDAATGTTSVNANVAYYQDGALVYKAASRTVYDSAGNVIKQVGGATQLSSTWLCDQIE
jgi:hypothetical protein